MNSDSTGNSIWQELILAFHILRDPQTPFYIKMMPMAALLYFLFPEGWIVFPLATPIDDIALAYVALKGLVQLTPPQIVARHKKSLGMDVVEGEYQVVENDVADSDAVEDSVGDKELDASIVLNPDKLKADF